MPGRPVDADLTAPLQARHPRLARYLAQLPEGLGSFPDSGMKASVFRSVLDFSEAVLTGLPPTLQSLVDDAPPSTSWIPQCQGLALVIASVEAQQLQGEAEGAWVRSASARLFESPMYRFLMRVVTPALLYKGAQMRWSAFFRGSELVSVLGDRTAEITLVCPASLFTHDLAIIFTDVLRAATNLTQERTGSLDLETFTPGAIRYRGTW